MMPLPSRADCTSGGDLPLPELLLVNLSEKLFSLPRGRDIAVQYLSSCPRAGEEALRALIQHVQVRILLFSILAGSRSSSTPFFLRVLSAPPAFLGSSGFGL